MLAAALGATLGAAWLAGGAGPAGGADASSSSGTGSTWTTAQGAWAALPMGHLDQPHNTFWELLFRRDGAARWTLVTPPGVASNGGIVGVSTPQSTATVTVGFEPTQLLRYSPVARTTDDGAKWSAGALPTGLTQVADAVATGPNGQVLALERAKDGTLVRASGSLTRWSTVTTGHGLANGPARSCGLRALTAVAVTTDDPIVGAACANPGVVGLFAEAGGTWTSVGPALPGQSSATLRVLRLTVTAAGTAALVEATSRKGVSLLALWRRDGTWSASAPLHVDGRVRSAGTGADLSTVVVTAGSSGRAQVHSISGPGAAWSAAAAPRGTQVVVAASAPSPAGAASTASAFETALAVSNSWVTVWRRGAGSWTRVQRFKVPIEYGSST